MGGLKEQDVSLGSTEKVKKPRGNPNLKKGVRNPYYESGNTQKTQNPMAEAETNTAPEVENNGVKKEIPDDLFSDAIPSDPVLPLDGEVKTKDYAVINDGSANGGGGGGKTPPNPPVSGDTTPPPSGDGSIPNPNPESGTIPPIGTPGGKSPEEIRTEAEQMVKLILKGYDKLHGVGRWVGKVDDNQLMNLHMQKKIDLDYQLPLGTKHVAVREFFAGYNQEIDENIIVTEEFKEAVTPPLVRIAIKRGWSMGDEMYVMMLAAEDLGTKMSMLIGLKKSANLILDACMQIMKAKNAPPKETKKENPDINPDHHWRDAPSQDVNYEEVK